MKSFLRSMIAVFYVLSCSGSLIAAEKVPLPVMKTDEAPKKKYKKRAAKRAKKSPYSSSWGLPDVKLPAEADWMYRKLKNMLPSQKAPAKKKRHLSKKSKTLKSKSLKSEALARRKALAKAKKDLAKSKRELAKTKIELAKPSNKITAREKGVSSIKKVQVPIKKNLYKPERDLALNKDVAQPKLKDKTLIPLEPMGDKRPSNKTASKVKPTLTAQIPLPILRPKTIIENKTTKKMLSKGPDLKDKKSSDLSPKTVALPIPPPVTKWPEEEVKLAQQQCKLLLKGVDVSVTPIHAIRKDACGDPAPLKITAFGAERGKTTVISPAATLNCEYTARLGQWISKKLQPLAMKHFKQRVKMIHNISSYSCRKRYNNNEAKLSEHAKANALDIAGVTLADGTIISVLKHWDEENDAEKSAFLKEMHKTGCASFVVALGPEANAAHKNHFHFDLGRYPVCE